MQLPTLNKILIPDRFPINSFTLITALIRNILLSRHQLTVQLSFFFVASIIYIQAILLSLKDISTTYVCYIWETNWFEFNLYWIMYFHLLFIIYTKYIKVFYVNLNGNVACILQNTLTVLSVFDMRAIDEKENKHFF